MLLPDNAHKQKPIMHAYLDFETQIAELEGKIEELRQLAAQDPSMDIGDDVTRLETKVDTQLKDIYGKLTPWQKTMVARHPNRPHFRDYVGALITDFTPLAGDRLFAEDRAIVSGFGRFNGQSVAVIGHEKGFDTATRLEHNFGMAMPEGYRKAVRIMRLADQFKIPILSLVDTAGAYPGVSAEERGQAEAIARSTETCLSVGVPLISVIIGEGGSGGAIAIATGDQVMMLEHSIYSVISPEGCASILWRDPNKAKDAASAMKLTAQHLKDLHVIDEIIKEPVGGAHREPEKMITSTGLSIQKALAELSNQSSADLRKSRRQKYLDIGRQGLT